MLAAIVNVSHLVAVSGYPLLFVLVMSESSGVPIPGETALIAAAVLASRGELAIPAVIALALLALFAIAVAAAAIALNSVSSHTKVVLRNVVYSDIQRSASALKQLVSENTR